MIVLAIGLALLRVLKNIKYSLLRKLLDYKTPPHKDVLNMEEYYIPFPPYQSL